MYAFQQFSGSGSNIVSAVPEFERLLCDKKNDYTGELHQNANRPADALPLLLFFVPLTETALATGVPSVVPY